MTARPVAPVIPGASPGRNRQGNSGARRPMPLASPLGRPDVVYGFGRVDASGRVADRVTIAALGWRGGDRLTLTAEVGVMTARRDPGGMVTVPARPYVVIPAALRCVYRRAVDDGLIAEAGNPARKVAKPRRLPTTRRALPDTRLAQTNQTAAVTGDDPELDTLLLRLHTEIACRRGGALALRPRDLDAEQCLVLLWEKGETVRWQPVSPTLMGRLVEHGQERHAAPDGQLLRYAGRAADHLPPV